MLRIEGTGLTAHSAAALVDRKLSYADRRRFASLASKVSLDLSEARECRALYLRSGTWSPRLESWIRQRM